MELNHSQEKQISNSMELLNLSQENIQILSFYRVKEARLDNETKDVILAIHATNH